MFDPSPSSLDAFNRQVLLVQEEAFTLACDLLGDESLAVKAVEEAFVQVYRRERDGHSPIRLPVLAAVVRACSRSAVCPALYLIDHLGLAYAEAARVLHCSPAKVAEELAGARRELLQCGRIGEREGTEGL